MLFTLFVFLLFVVPLKAQDEPVSLTKDQLTWGESEFTQMLKDRPAMAPYVKKGDELWNWMVRQFAGEGGAGNVQWDSSNPGWDAVSCGPNPEKNKLAWIKVTRNFTQKGVREGKPKSGAYLWANTFMEIFNIKNSKRIAKIDRRAWSGEIGREAFIVECYSVETDSGLDAYNFFKDVWVPHCEKMKLPYEDDILVEQYGEKMKPLNIEDNLGLLFRPGDHHYESYGKNYDENFPKYSKQLEKLKKEAEKASGSIPPPP